MSDAASISGPRDRRWLILAVIGLAQLMVILDFTVMNIALPSAQRALHFQHRGPAVGGHRLHPGVRQPAAARRRADRVSLLELVPVCEPDLRGGGVRRRGGAAEALAHGYRTGFWWIADIFACGAVVGGALLRRGPLGQRHTASPAPDGVTTAPAR